MAAEQGVSEPQEQASTSLTRADLELIFRTATKSFVNHHESKFANGMSDGQLWRALQASLGIFGGSGGPGRPSVAYQGSMLKIWGGWSVVNHVTSQPIFSGQATVDMAREVYGIADPENDQLSLL